MFRRYSVSQAFALTAYFTSPLPGLLRILALNCHSVKDLLIKTSFSSKKKCWRMIIHNGFCKYLKKKRVLAAVRLFERLSSLDFQKPTITCSSGLVIHRTEYSTMIIANILSCPTSVYSSQHFIK
jgi:hypothetical protein